MSRYAHRWLAGLGFLALLALHLDFWRPRRVKLYFGWLAEELLWRLAWIALAFCYLAYLSWKLWPPEEEE